jgi:hypothetical protein
MALGRDVRTLAVVADPRDRHGAPGQIGVRYTRNNRRSRGEADR